MVFLAFMMIVMQRYKHNLLDKFDEAEKNVRRVYKVRVSFNGPDYSLKVIREGCS